jgi:hypothetical protein
MVFIVKPLIRKKEEENTEEKGKNQKTRRK